MQNLQKDNAMEKNKNQSLVAIRRYYISDESPQSLFIRIFIKIHYYIGFVFSIFGM